MKRYYFILYLLFGVMLQAQTQVFSSSPPAAQFAQSGYATAIMNGITVTRRMTSSSPIYSGAKYNTNSCLGYYPSGYAFLYSGYDTTPQSITYTFSQPITSIQIFNLLFGNYSRSDGVDYVDFSVNGGGTLTISEYPAGIDCKDMIFVSGTRVYNYPMTNETTDASFYISSTKPFTSLTLTDPLPNVYQKSSDGFGTIVELGPQSLCVAPYYNTQPASTTICQNATTTLTASVGGNTSISYQWYRNTSATNTGGAPIAGATSASYTPPSNTVGTFYYYLVATNACSSTASNVATFTVVAPAIAGTASTNQTICAGSTPAALTLKGYNGTIRWQQSTNGGSTWTDIASNATSATYQPGPTTQTTLFRASVSNSACGKVYSNAVTITVSAASSAPAPTLSQPNKMVMCGNTTTDLSGITASNTPAGLSLGWFTTSTPSAATKIANINAVGPGTYYAAFYDSNFCYATSTTAFVVYKELCVTAPPALTVFIRSNVSRDLSKIINPNGGNGTYTYKIVSGCTAPAGAVGTISPTLSGSLASGTAPSTAGTYYYCVQICDTAPGALNQCKTVTVPINVTTASVFSCDNSVYLSRFNGSSNLTEIYRVAHNANSVDMQLIGTSATGVLLNNISYNTVDSKIYGVGTHGILKVVTNDPNNAVAEAFSTPVSGLPATSSGYWDYNAGGFYNGFLYVQATGANNMFYRIDIANNTATAITLSRSLDMGDIAYSDVAGAFVGYDNSTKQLMKIDATTGAVTNYPYVNSAVSELGVIYTDGLGNIYGKDGSTGTLYQFNLTTGQAYKVYQSSQFLMAKYDGVHCPTASLTFSTDVEITKTDNVTSYKPGQTLNYVITVKNNNTVYAINNVVVKDVIPAGLTATYTATASAGATTQVTGTATGDINDVVYLPVGGSVTYNVTVNVPMSFSGSITNTATATVPPNYTDINPTNNSSTDNDTSDVCYKAAALSGVSVDSPYGVTALGRAGATNGNWPMVRKGAWVVLESKTKGFVPNQLTDTDISNIPSANLVVGMMVYNITQDCLMINTDGTASGWKCFKTQTCPY